MQNTEGADGGWPPAIPAIPGSSGPPSTFCPTLVTTFILVEQVLDVHAYLTQSRATGRCYFGEIFARG